jgi:regulator of protease activity HflC (stomatin/prohibitin superfamily)
MTTTPETLSAPSMEPSRPGRWARLRSWARRRSTGLKLTTLIVLALLVYFANDMFVTVGSGEAAVLWRRFGGGTVTVAEDDRSFIGRIQADRSGEPMVLRENMDRKNVPLAYPFAEGMHVIFPWNRMKVYNIRLQQVSHTYDALTSDGLDVKVEITIRFKPIEEDLGKLHRDIGPRYVDTLIIPIIGSYARQEIARFEPDALYSPKRIDIQEAIRADTKKALVSRFYPEKNRESYVIVDDVLIRNVILPAEVRAAIQEKVVQKQLAASYQYRLLREKLEADRKAIEAAGIQRFQAAIGGSISEQYLKLKGIEATLELAKSPNAKIIIVGGKDGLPLLLDGSTSAPAAPAKPAKPPRP